MSASIFSLKSVEPNEKMLASELGETIVFLDEIISSLTKIFGAVTKEWKYYGAKSGWVMKVLTKKKNQLFVIPCANYFRVSLTFSDRAVNKIMKYELPGFNKQVLLNATKYAEGRTIQYDVKTAHDCGNVLALLGIKLQL